MRTRWTNKQLRQQVEVINGVVTPHIILKNATYLNHYIHDWIPSNIWIYNDRIVYVESKYSS